MHAFRFREAATWSWLGLAGVWAACGPARPAQTGITVLAFQSGGFRELQAAPRLAIPRSKASRRTIDSVAS